MNTRSRARRASLFLEDLESRLAPANVFVVPVGQPADAGHFHTLRDAVAAAGTSGDVTVEPGASPDPQFSTVVLTQPFLTVHGDRNVPASILPRYQIELDNMHIQLENLNLGFLTLSGSHGLSEFNTITKCLIQDVNGSDMGSTFSQNLITGSVSVHGHARAVDIGPVFFLSNVFTSTAIPALWLIRRPARKSATTLSIRRAALLP